MPGRYWTNEKTGQQQWFDNVNGEWVPGTPPGQPFDFSASQTLSNVPGSLKQFGKDLVTPLTHPINTATSLANLAIGISAKVMPGKQHQEVYANAFGQMLKDRYGSLDNVKRTFQNDPIGVASDVAGILTMGGGLASKTAGKIAGQSSQVARGANAVKQAGLTIDPVNVAMQGANRAVQSIPKVRAGTQALASNMMASATKFPTSKRSNPLRQASVQDANVQTMLGEKLLPNLESLGKLQNRISDVGDRITALIDSAPADAKIKVADILDSLDDARKEIDIPGDPNRGTATAKLGKVRRNLIESAADQRTLRQMQSDIKSAATPAERQAARVALSDYIDDVAVNGTLTVKEAQKAKQLLGQRQNFDAAPGASTFENQRGVDAIRRGERAGLEQIMPDLKSLNQQQGGLLQLQDDLPRVVRRIENRNPISATAVMGGLLGVGADVGGAGGLGTMAAGLLAISQTPGGLSRAALMLQRMVDAGQLSASAAGDIAKLLPLQAAKGAGRAGQQEALHGDMPSLMGFGPQGLLQR